MVRLKGLCAGLLLASSAWVSAASGGVDASAPIVIHSPQSAKAGDIVGFQGENFGTDPQAVLDGAEGTVPVALERINTYGTGWAAFRLPQHATGALVVRVGNGLAFSAPVKLNAARAFHLDTLQISSLGKFRIFGRNLLLPGSVPVVTLNGVPVVLDLAASNAHMLVATAPAQWDLQTLAQIRVDNGNGSGATPLDRAIAYQAGSGKDPFALGTAWADAFDKISTRTIAADSDPRLQRPVQCNGLADDTRALQEAVDLAHKTGGAQVQLPAGVCRLEGSVVLKSRVVLQGAGKAKTVLASSGNYPLMGRGIALAGLRDFTLTHQRPGAETALLQNSERVFFKNVAFALNGGIQMFLTGNRNFVVDHCDFTQPKNSFDNGPFVLSTSSGLVFTHNRVVFANGSPSFGRVHDAFIADNHISRDARDNLLTQGVVHSLTLDFAHRVALVGNRFDVLGGPVTNKVRNDGETVLTEGGGGKRTENVGYVQSATALTLTDPDVQHTVDPFVAKEVPENYSLTIVGGRGTGQSRRVVAYADRTFTVDRPWDIVPDTSSRYATFVWGLEKSLIQGNVLAHNPRGIWLYQTAVREVDIVSNTFTEGGGIYLRTAQNLQRRLFTPMHQVRIADNTVTNSTGEWPSYIHLAFVRMDGEDFGFGSIGVEVRGNSLQANKPNIQLPKEESGAVEGFVARSYFEGPTQAVGTNQPRLLGTIFQDNRCSACNNTLVIRHGTVGTVLDSNATTD